MQRIGKRKATLPSLPKIMTKPFTLTRKLSRLILRNIATTLIVPLLTIISETISNASLIAKQASQLSPNSLRLFEEREWHASKSLDLMKPLILLKLHWRLKRKLRFETNLRKPKV